MRRMKHLLLIALALTACKSSKSSPAESGAKPVEGSKQVAAVPCDPAATELATRLDTANGLGMPLDAPETQSKIDTAKQGLEGTTVAFKDCAFSSQGNDAVTFAATKGGKDLECIMAGGEAGNRKFRDAAMSLDMQKLKLDVTGKLAKHGEEPLARIQLTECTITPHE